MTTDDLQCQKASDELVLILLSVNGPQTPFLWKLRDTNVDDVNKTITKQSFVPKDFILKKTLRMFRLLWVSWSSCRRWVGWPAGWTDCRSPARQKNGSQRSTQSDYGMEECVRASGSERNIRSYKHGKGSHVVLPVLSMTWQPARHDHFRYRLGVEHQRFLH